MVDYKFHNANPLGKIEEDCVTRAITNATDIPYYEVAKKLRLVGELFECDKLCVCCYKFLLTNVFGFKERVANRQTVRDIAGLYPYDKVIIRIDGHLTMSNHGVIEDTWDCRDEIADLYWVVK